MGDFGLQQLREAVAGRAAAFRTKVELQPAGGPGTKVFPPTYAGAVYAVEKRRLPDKVEPITCVLLDSVQSQANRMEEALQTAVDEGRIRLPVIEVDFSDRFSRDGDPTDEQPLLDPIGKVTSLQVPHRIADAILRDSVVTEEDKQFRHKDLKKESSYGQRLRRVSAQDATVLFELCPTALLFGMWDSTGPKGGLGAKFERAMVSEIVGLNAVFGVKTSSRLDPLSIKAGATIYHRNADGGLDWTSDTDDPAVVKDKKGNPVPYNRSGNSEGTPGNPSKANHSNVTPSFGKFTKGAEGLNPLTDTDARQGQIAPGGVTIDCAEQSIVLSLPALRRLKFPVNGDCMPERDAAARTVLAALGLCAAALADESGLDLRSRCLLWPTQESLSWELLQRGKAEAVSLTADEAVELFNQSVEAAKNEGLPWRDDPLVLQPSEQLVQLVANSQRLTVDEGSEAE
ncbi:CRISPR-associated protein (Cas_GSU0053) [Posidoniimonas corsicana]|uniref:CRISPR-associated protein (Cas_GSU0053) n=1 Tax=Posidoniimonas corsicana TaxID=1938618 RepID=A0A5C5URS2_9BACT|nr:type I-U CRISPR-associated RAMP protein Csb1/Cas7u [Posidoniimonas corsicana]TWT29171.1 CRISPR-associated protein (Cas_GSU0053) [Posidoniimonas corsicana]